MAESGRTGIVRPIVIGVATTVLTAVILYQLNLNGNDGAGTSQLAKTSVEDRARLRDLEDQISNLNHDQLEQKQRDLDARIVAAQQTVQQASTRQPDPYNQAEQPFVYGTEALYSHIGGVWQDYSTGASYRVIQNGDAFTIEEVSLGMITAAGSGRMVGLNGTFSYQTLLGTNGAGKLSLSQDGSLLSCTFTDHTAHVTLSAMLQR